MIDKCPMCGRDLILEKLKSPILRCINDIVSDFDKWSHFSISHNRDDFLWQINVHDFSGLSFHFVAKEMKLRIVVDHNIGGERVISVPNCDSIEKLMSKIDECRQDYLFQ